MRHDHEVKDMNNTEMLEETAKASESSSMAMDLIRHIAGLYSGKAIKGDFTQIYITGNEIWMAQQILASQQGDQGKNHEQAEISKAERDAFEAHESRERRLSPADQKFWFRRGVLADYDCKAIDDAWKAWKARAAAEIGRAMP